MIGDPNQDIRLCNELLTLAERCRARAGDDADEAVSEAWMEGHKKPIAEADTAKYYYVCLRRVACRRIARMQILLPIDFDMPVPEIADTTEWMREAINRLPHREQHVIALRFYSGGRKKPTYKTIGRQFGLSGERVRQLEVRALEVLRVMLEEE